MIDCYDEGQLRAYLDGELPPRERAKLGAHLASCAACQGQLERLRLSAARVRSLLAAPPAAPEPRSALGRLRASQRSTVPMFQRSNLQRSTFMQSHAVWSGRRRPLLAGLAVLVAILSLLALPPLRVAADNLLSIFRVQKLMFVPVSPERIEQLSKLNFDKDTLFLSKPAVEKADPPRSVASAEEAANAVGAPVAQPSVFPSAPLSTEFKVSNPAKIQFQVNVESARQLLALMGVDDVSLPDALGTAPVAVDVPAFAVTSYHGANYELMLHQGQSPSVTLPDGVDLSQLGKAALRLLGMPSADAELASRTINWNNTLLFP
ncbi:MAG TPA: zf-HC2 domain-containing protein, partial [Roseiflexaceae bacterium]|nr:zf-HC2 domain-containing protein [Roseiflexaceae bacterium]